MDKLKTVSIDLKRLSDLFDKNVLKKSKYNADKQGLDSKIEHFENKHLMLAD